MNLKEKIQKIWENKEKIAEGLFNEWLSSSKEVKEEIDRRVAICQSNECGHYDAEGIGDNVVVQGKPACGVCGCNIPTKPACMSCTCSLVDIGKNPLWGAIMTQEQEDMITAQMQENRRLWEEKQRAKREQQNNQ